MNQSYTIRQVKTPQEMNEVMRIRTAVFIEEQKVPQEIEMDSYDEDPKSIFHLAVNENGEGVGCLRFRPYDEGKRIGKVERVAVLKEHRGKQIGRLLMEEIEKWAKENGFLRLKLHAQHQVEPFYSRLGYESIGDLFEEAGILHIRMEKDLKA